MANAKPHDLEYYQVKAMLAQVIAKISDYENKYIATSSKVTHVDNISERVKPERQFKNFDKCHVETEEIIKNKEVYADFPLHSFEYSLENGFTNDRAQQSILTHKNLRLKSILFYIGCVALIFVAIFAASGRGESGAPRHLFGFSAMRVLTGSMQSEIPQNSFIITRRTNPSNLRVGDDITFMVSENSTVTHRIIAIIEDYDETGERGFRTKGIENSSADRTIVIPSNIVGRVVFSNLFLGSALFFISQNAAWIVVFTALCIALITSLKIFLFPAKAKANKMRDVSQPTSI